MTKAKELDALLADAQNIACTFEPLEAVSEVVIRLIEIVRHQQRLLDALIPDRSDDI